MRLRVPAAVAAAFLAVAPLPLRAADAPAPIRTLTYAVELSTDARTNASGGAVDTGIGPAVMLKGRIIGTSSGGGTMSGNGDRFTEAQRTAKGSIDVAIVQATTDAGLVIDIKETTDIFSRPTVRIGIAGDGTLFYNPADAGRLREEEIVIARWLGRGFYRDRPTEVGTAWVVDLSAEGRTDLERYRVVKHDDARVTLAYSFEEKTSKAGAYAGTREGSLVYDTAMVIPVKATFETHLRRLVGGTYDTVRSDVDIALTADSFAKRGG